MACFPAGRASRQRGPPRSIGFSSQAISGKIEPRKENNAPPINEAAREHFDMSGRHHFGIAIAAIGMLISAAAGAQEYPTKPITLIVPWPAGGSTDISMRAIADSASKIARPADRDRQQGRRRRHGRPGHHGGGSQARRLHHRADPDHRVPPAADAGSLLGSGQGLLPTSFISPATPSASPPAPSRHSRPGRTSSTSPRRIPAR